MTDAAPTPDLQHLQLAWRTAGWRGALLDEIRDELAAAGFGRPETEDWPDVLPALRELIAERDQLRAAVAPPNASTPPQEPVHDPGGSVDAGPRPEPPDGRTACAYCGREIENRPEPTMGWPSRDNWVHIPGGYRVCHPQQPNSPRAEPSDGRTADPAQPCDGCGHPEHPARECPAVEYGERCACDEPVA